MAEGEQYDGNDSLGSILQELAKFGPAYPGMGTLSILSSFKIVITTKREDLCGSLNDTNIYYAATNLPELLRNTQAEPTMFLHPAFFDLSDLKQLEILYWCVVSQLTKRIVEPDKAKRDTEMFIRFYRTVNNID